MSYDHLPAAECGNFWMENDQANTLAGGNVAKYSLSVNWARLGGQGATPEPEPTGYTNRWYVTPLSLGQGVSIPPSSTLTSPTYCRPGPALRGVCPDRYKPAKPTKLTWILHSLGANLNQYGGVAPSQIQEECQDRTASVPRPRASARACGTTPQAEVDFFDVWHQLALPTTSILTPP